LDIVFTPVAAKSGIADFVESKNTPGSGKRYALKFQKAIKGFAQPNVQYAYCRHVALARLKYCCRRYNDWIVAFKIEDDTLTVYQIVHGSVLS
jgi:hypothetical protein